jgi:hypothetical protein
VTLNSMTNETAVAAHHNNRALRPNGEIVTLQVRTGIAPWTTIGGSCASRKATPYGGRRLWADQPERR